MAAPGSPKALVLGASGFLGAHLAAALVAHAREEATYAEPYGAPVYGTSRAPDTAPSFCDPRDALGWVEVDLAAEGKVARLLDELRPTHVLNAAALSRVGDCAEQPELARRMNTEVPRELAAWCARERARFVHVSTDMVFGKMDAPSGGFEESAEPGPVNEYGETKLAGEEAVLDADPEALVVRLPLLYGNSGGRGRGASDSLLESVDRGETPGLYTNEWRTPLEVRNAAAALVELLGGAEAGVLHVAGPDRTSRHALGLAILGAMGLSESEALAAVDAVSSEAAERGERPRDVALNSDRAQELLETVLLGIRAGAHAAVR